MIVKNSEVMHYLFKELKNGGIEIEWNIFQDKHGLKIHSISFTLFQN
jgi:hypothetical protein